MNAGILRGCPLGEGVDRNEMRAQGGDFPLHDVR